MERNKNSIKRMDKIGMYYIIVKKVKYYLLYLYI